MRKLSKEEKQKRGTLNGRHKEPATGQPMAGLPTPPQWLSDTAKGVFADVVSDLFNRGLLFKADVTLIAAYCTEIAQFIELTELINNEGYIYKDKNGQKRKHPALIPQRAAYQSAISTAKTLGLGPYFRDKVGLQEPGIDNFLANEIDRLAREHNLNAKEIEFLKEAIEDPLAGEIYPPPSGVDKLKIDRIAARIREGHVL